MTKYVTQDNLDKLHPDVRKIADEVVDKMHSKDTYFFDIIKISLKNKLINYQTKYL